MKELQLGIGDTITVYKANMIIPQIAENLTEAVNWKFRIPALHVAMETDTESK